MTRRMALPLLGLLLAAWATSAEPDLPVFTDVTETAGIRFKHSYGDYEMDNIVEATGSGACIFDYDNDGLLDIYLVNGRWQKGVSDNRGRDLRDRLGNVLYRNNGDWTFTDVTEKTGVRGKGMGFGCSAADFDNDGDLDLYVLNYGPNEFYRNDGGTFTDISEKTGLANPRWSLSAPWLDYNNDGLLDVYVANYLEYDEGKFRAFYAAAGHPGPLSYHGQPDALYRNNGDGTFSEVSREAGIYNPEGRAMSAAAADLNSDGFLDIYVANDAMENYYYENTGKGAFEEKALKLGMAFGENGQGVSSMGPVVGDVDRNGLLDIFIPDMSYSTLLLNFGAYFEDFTTRAKLAVICGQYTGWGAAMMDYDNDGFLDLFVANGNALHEFTEEAVLARNNGKPELEFVNVSDRSGSYFHEKYVGRGVASGDLDNDGDIDLVVCNLNDRPRLLRNDGGSAGNWLTVEVKRANGRSEDIGARVTVHTGAVRQIQDVVAVTGYLSQSDPRAHFGLGKAEKADLVEVRFSGGRVRRFENVRARQLMKVIQDAPEK